MNPNQNKTFVGILVHSWLILAVALLLAACGNPRREAPPEDPPAKPAPEEPAKPAPVKDALLAVRYAVGQKFRTTRTLSVSEQTESGTVSTQADEITITEVKEVDGNGRLIAAIRSYDRSRQRFARGATPEETTGAIEGAVLELRRKDAASPVSATVIKGNPDLAGPKFLLDGFDAALLPAATVAEADNWSLQGAELLGLNAIIEALGFKIEKNRLDCRVMALSEKTAAISLDWRLTGSFNQQPAVLEFTGTLEFDRVSGLIARFNLGGGRQGGGKSVEINVVRAAE
ncbi:MAG: hypothetical protein IT462_13535 [Planctomycetes bacterium]|nr:hypothetical protein [Planctomycetota bacterium]